MANARHANGASIRVIRELLGLRAVDLCRRANISKTTLSLLENGTRDVSAPLLLRIARSLGVPLEAISYPAATYEP